MEIIKMVNGQEITASIRGRLDTVTAPQLEQFITENIANMRTLTLDFAELEYISSAGLRVLLSAQKKMQQIGSLTVKNVREEIMEVFEMTGFADILTIE